MEVAVCKCITESCDNVPVYCQRLVSLLNVSVHTNAHSLDTFLFLLISDFPFSLPSSLSQQSPLRWVF